MRAWVLLLRVPSALMRRAHRRAPPEAMRRELRKRMMLRKPRQQGRTLAPGDGYQDGVNQQSAARLGGRGRRTLVGSLKYRSSLTARSDFSDFFLSIDFADFRER